MSRLPCLRPAPGGCRIALRVHPGGRRNRIVGILGDTLKLEVRRPPERGEATDAALALLAASLEVPRQTLRLLSGVRSRNKVVEVVGLSPDEADQRLRTLVDVTSD